jgi:hypothetical protein
MTAKRLIKNKTPYHSNGNTIMEKLCNFATFLKNECDGWTGKIWVDDNSGIHYLQAFRDDNEKIEIEWPTVTWPIILHTIANHTIKCRNVSHAAKIAYAEPDTSRLKRAGRGRRVDPLGGRLQDAQSLAPGRNSPDRVTGTPDDSEALEAIVAATKSYVPFDKESTKEEVEAELKRLRNPNIVWIGPLTHRVNSALVKTRSKHFKVNENKNGKIVLHFADDFGFHAVYADSIIAVS